jgi:hypothetical protein
MRSLTSRCCERSHFRLDLLYSADVHRITEVVPSVWSGACPFSRNPTSCVVLRSGYRSRYTYGGARALTASRPCHVLSFKRLVITCECWRARVTTGQIFFTPAIGPQWPAEQSPCPDAECQYICREFRIPRPGGRPNMPRRRGRTVGGWLDADKV